MPTMSAFHRKLSATPEVHDPLFQGLIEMTRADLGVFQALKGGWDNWNTTPLTVTTS